MSTRKSLRTKKVPDRFTPTNNKEKDSNSVDGNTDIAHMNESHTENKTAFSSTSTSASRRSKLQIELEKLEEINRLEKEMALKEIERQKRLDDMERQKIERQKRLDDMERQKERDELERQKRLLEMRAELKSASVSSRHDSASEVCSSIGINEKLEDESQHKVENWLNDKEQMSNVVQMSSSAILSSAVEKLADSFRQAIHLDKPNSNSLRQHLPSFSGKPEEWPIFYSAYEKTKQFFNEEDNLIRLRNCLEGDAFKMVKPLFISGKNLNAVVKTLQMRFGRPELILESMQKKTKMLPPVKEGDINGLIEFSTHILNFTTTAESLQMENYMTNPQLLMELLEKLPYNLRYNWAQNVRFLSLSKPNLKDLSLWLEEQCSIMSIYFRPQPEPLNQRKSDTKLVMTNSTKENKLCYCMFCNEKHESAQCKVFRKAEVSERWKMVAEKKLCFFCFRQHPIKFCKIKKSCGINNCKLFHSRLLHIEKSEKPSDSGKETEHSGNKIKEINSKHTEESITKNVLLRVCPVTLYGPKCQMDTYALLDDGSTISLLDSSTADKLGVEGKTEPLTTCWSNSTCHFDSSSRKVSLKIKGLYEDEVYTLENVRTQSPLDLPLQNVDTVKLRDKWSHLNSLSQPLPTVHSKPTILIGQDNVNLMLTRKLIEGPANSPVLSWSYLGWSMHGKCAQDRGRVDENVTLTMYEYDKLHDLVKRSFEIEKFGNEATNDIKLKSKDDERAVSILENTVKKTGDHYEAGLLWKSNDFNFPPSYDNAFKRLQSIERKMEKNQDFKRKYTEKMNDYIKKGYVQKLTKEKAEVVTDRTYYLPHFGVTNPNKPGKLRLVFDAAAKSNGVSFNDGLISGPDYLNSLPSVLLKFRIGKYAIVGDIKEMFHQVWIRDEDVNAQRFLWRDGNPKQKPDTYLMKAMTFGSTCSPSVALYVVNKNAKEFESIYPEASRSILTKEYMDDLLDSTNSEEEARRRIHEVTEIHKAGGFEICNWLSNSKEVLQDVPENLKANSTKQLKSDTNLPTERVLGMWWNAESDTFDFHHSTEKVNFSEVEYPTKREILSAAMSIFDPLGLITPTTIKGRLLVQDIWRLKITWDEVLPLELCKKWHDWLEEVKSLSTIKIQRSYFVSSKIDGLELHTFVDASEEAYAAVAYLRQENNGNFETMLVSSRAKVAPLKTISIPRMELQAAALGCRMAFNIQKDIDLHIVQRMFWSDSVTVLHWIRSDPKTYNQFVSNRIGEIQELSISNEWRWVPSKLNPADITTRSTKKFNSSIHEEWLHGPNFLRHETSCWPDQPESLQLKNDLEKKRQFIGTHSNNKLHPIEINKFSSWERLTRIVAWIQRYVKVLLEHTKSNTKVKLKITKNIEYDKIVELRPNEIKEAESLLFKLSQEESFKEELNLLKAKHSVPKSSRIYTLLPFIDERQIIRMSSRVCNSPEFDKDQINPIILDGKSSAAELIVKMFHEACFHQGVETVICKVRERFWITNLRSTVKKVKHRCTRCVIDKARPVSPQMAPLPEVRVSRVEHPFYYTGVDYFGPIEVTVGRRHEKRWGVLFTCLSTRAIHLEVAHSLNTESCIMAIQRFIGRRPCPSEMFSDNGTNFIAAEKELRNAVETLDHVHIQRTVIRNGIKWNFIPPRAPHMGGCWERLIRSVKTALRAVMKSQYPRDEEFQTLLVRVEFIINSRPLTHVSMDPNDLEPLTPNHFLREGFKISVTEDKLCKKQLVRVKSLLDSFWKRWVHEYLPCLTRRCKWHSKTIPPKIGDLAIIVDENNPRNTWPLGRISSTYPGKDGQVRVVDVSTTYGTFKRPLTKVAVL